MLNSLYFCILIIIVCAVVLSKFITFFLGMIFLVMAVSSCRHDKTLNRAEADRSLKALDSDLTRIADAVSQSPGSLAINSLGSFENAPVPIKTKRTKLFETHGMFMFDRMKGEYTWNAATTTFDFHPGGNTIVIWYPLKNSTGNRACCIIYDYSEVQTTSFARFPLILKADISVDNQKVFSIDHHASLSCGFPVMMTSDLWMGNSSIRLSMTNRLDTLHKRGAVTLKLFAGNPAHWVIQSVSSAEIELFRGGTYGLLTLESKTRLFDFLLDMRMNYLKISPSSRQYAEDFNSNSSITLYDESLHARVGTLMLQKSKEEENRLDFMIRFSDGTDGFLSDWLLIYKKFLHFKHTFT